MSGDEMYHRKVTSIRRVRDDDQSTSDKMTQQIDENLKRAYQETLSEALPDRFQQLLAQLREQEKRG